MARRLLPLLAGLALACPAADLPAVAPTASAIEAAEAPTPVIVETPAALTDPAADDDDDGIAARDDDCPSEPECVNGIADADGCPDRVPEEVAALEGTIEGLEFEHRTKATLALDSLPLLESVAAVLVAYPELELEIQAHEDTVTADQHRYMSARPTQRQAEAVAKFLIQQGVAAERIQARGYGEDRPIDTNKTEEGRRHNRRVDLVFTAPAWRDDPNCGQSPL